MTTAQIRGAYVRKQVAAGRPRAAVVGKEKFEMKQTRFATLFVALAMLCSCGQTPENSIESARLALGHRKPNQALEMVNRALEKQPDNLEALELKARAQILLGQTDSSRKTIGVLIERGPDNVEYRRLHIAWCFVQASRLIKKADYPNNNELQRQMAQVLLEGRRQAQWIAEQGGLMADGLFYRARLAEEQIRSIDRILEGMSTTIRRGVAEGAESEEAPGIAVHALKSTRRRLYDEVMSYLGQTIGLKPDHFDAAAMYARLLKQKQMWPEIWVLAENLAIQKDMPPMLGDQMVVALIQMPSSIQPRSRRLATASQIQEAVAPAQRESIDWMIGSVRLHLVVQEYDEAKKLLARAVALKPRHINGRYLLAQALFGQKKFVKAKEILDKLYTEVRRSDEVMTLYGMTLVETGQLKMAKDVLAEARSLNPKNMLAQERYFQLLASDQKLNMATESVKDFYEANPTNPRAIRMMVRYLQAGGQVDELRKILDDKVRRGKPLEQQHLVILINGYFYLRDFANAERFAQKLTEMVPHNMTVHLRLAEAMLMRQKDGAVRRMLQDLAKRMPEMPPVDQVLGRLYLRRQRFDEALQLLGAVVERDPRNHDARLLLARALANRSMTEQCMEHIRQVLEEAPEHRDAHSLAARIYQFSGQEEKANEHLSHIDAKDIDEQRYPALLAQLKMKAEELDEAVDICNRAIGSGNTEPALRLLLARIYTRQKQYQKAEMHLLALVRDQPHNPQAYALLSRYYVIRRDLKRGLVELDKLRIDTGEQTLTRMARAVLLQAMGRPIKAVEELEVVYGTLVEEKQDYAMAVADAIARIQFANEQFEPALATYERMIRGGHMAGEAGLRQVDLHLGHRDQDGARALLEKMAEDFMRQNVRVRVHLMRRFVRLDETDRAMSLLMQWIDAEGEQALLVRWRGDLLMKKNEPVEAQRMYRRAIAIQPDSAMLHQRLAQAHVRDFDFPGAEAALGEMAKVPGAEVMALAAKGEMFLKLGLTRKAVATFDELERAGQPRDPNVIFAIGLSFADMGRLQQARTRLETIPLFSRRYADAQVLLADLEHRTGAIEKARKRLYDLVRRSRHASLAAQALLKLDRTDPQHQTLLGWADEAIPITELTPRVRLDWLRLRLRLFGARGDWDASMATAEEIAKLKPRSLTAITGRMALLVWLNRRESAAEIYRSTRGLGVTPLGPMAALLADEPVKNVPNESILSRYLRALVHRNVEAAQEAIEQPAPVGAGFKSDLAMILDRDDISSPQTSKMAELLGLAMLANESDLPHLAEHLCRTVLKKMPAMVPAYGLLGHAEVKLGKPSDKTRAMLAQNLPDSALELYLSARDRALNEDYVGAAENLIELSQREPNHRKVEYELSQILPDADRIDEAIELLNKIVASDGPYRLLASNDLAYQLAQRSPDRLDEAYQLAVETLKQDSGNPALHDTVGWLEYLRGNHREALAQLNRAVAALGKVPDVHYHLGRVYRELGLESWARYHLEEALSGPEQPWTEEVRGLLGSS
ncbi:MAG: hypothetical protein CMJ18_12600 [Phycisphaeraceae bacterium]|nr:hypothetical protein [Phycisphaeraceae bacterium]